VRAWWLGVHWAHNLLVVRMVVRMAAEWSGCSADGARLVVRRALGP